MVDGQIWRKFRLQLATIYYEDYEQAEAVEVYRWVGVVFKLCYSSLLLLYRKLDYVVCVSFHNRNLPWNDRRAGVGFLRQLFGYIFFHHGNTLRGFDILYFVLGAQYMDSFAWVAERYRKIVQDMYAVAYNIRLVSCGEGFHYQSRYRWCCI